MTITIEQRHCLPVLSVQGSIREDNWDALDRTVSLVGAEGHLLIGLDLSSVLRMGPSEARRLVALRDRMASGCQRLSLIGLSPCVITAMGQAL